MCGVFAYKGKRQDAPSIVFDGLKTLEYRGYDSWGIAVDSGEKLQIEKHVSKIGNTHIHLPKGNVAIGHTRWATHGGVTIENAHPHLDCSQNVAVLHNGIIENFQILKQGLQKKSHVFLSQTDTEVVPHMIEDYMKKTTFSKAVRKVFNKLHGLNAIVCLNAKTNEIIAAKNGSPLVVGIGNNEYFLASDLTGILPYTKKVIFLKDNEMVILGDKLSLVKLSGESLPIHTEHISWNIEQATKGKFEHFMLKEILEQSPVIGTIAKEYTEHIKSLSADILEAHGTFFIGSGTAYYACLTGMYLFASIAKRHVNTAAASEFNYLEDFLSKKSLIIALSQSGETIDVIEPLIRAQKKGAKIIGLVNSLGSTLYRMSDKKVLLGAGPEKAVASTKAYTAKLAILLLLSYCLAGKLGEAQEILLRVVKEMNRLTTLNEIKKIKKIASQLTSAEHIYTIGRGISLGAALEAALKIKEVSYIHTEGLAGGELKHGTIALIEKGTPCIVFAPSDETYDAIISNATEIKARGGFIIGIAAKNSPVFDIWIEVRDTGVGSIITNILPMQLLAYYIALEKKLDPDKPRNLAKSVTVK